MISSQRPTPVPSASGNNTPQPQPRAFAVVSSNILMGLPDGRLLSWCPTMHLLTICMNRTSVWVFRLNGERIYAINNKSPITHLRWSPLGKYFCVLGADKLIKIYDSNSGTLVNEVPSPLALAPGLVSWNSVAIDIHGEYDIGNVDLVGFLPKLDAADDVAPPHSAAIDFLTVVAANAVMSLTFNNVFTIDDIELPQYNYLHHVTDNLFCLHFLIEQDGVYSLVDVTLNVNKALQPDLAKIVCLCSQLISTCAHVRHHLSTLAAECTPHVVLFDRYLLNLKDSIGDDCLQTRMLNVLYDMLLTNLIPLDLKDFWQNQFGERGLKRLTKSGNSLYDSIRKTAYSQVVLALERMLLILNSLEGLSRWFTDSSDAPELTLDCEALTSVVDAVKSTIKAVYSLVWDINNEQRLFNKFLTWCKVEVLDKLHHEENDIEAFFKANSSASYKLSEILAYLNTYLFEPKVFDYFQVDADLDLLTKGTTSKNLMVSHTSVEDACTLFLDKLRDSVRRSIAFSDPVPVGLPAQTHTTRVAYVDNDILITGICDSRLHLIRGDVKRMVQFESVVTYELLGSHVAVLHETGGGRRLDLISCQSLLSSHLELTGLELVELVRSSKFPQVTSPTFLAVSKDHGCLLDSQRNYVVFRIGDC